MALSVTATGGMAPYSYTWAAPAGSTLSATSTSAVSATVSTSGVKTFTVTVAGVENSPVSTTVSVTVNPAPVVNNPSVTTATQGQPFSQPFTASDGSGSYSYSLASGTLPAGLSLTMGGVLSGTPTQTGSFSLSVQATDANGCAGVGGTYTLTVNR